MITPVDFGPFRNQKLASGVALCFAFSLSLSLGCGKPSAKGQYMETQRLHENSLTTLKGIGAKMERKQYALGEAWAIDLTGATVTDEAIAAMLGLDLIAELNFSNTNLTDDQLRQITNSRTGKILFNVNLSKANISDAGIGGLSASQFLKHLDVSGTKVTDAGISQLQKDRQANESIMPQFRSVQVKR